MAGARNPPVFAYQQPEENNGYLFWQVSMRWQLRMNQQLRAVGVTLTQFSLLAGPYWLNQQGEVITQQRLAGYAKTDKMMTSKVLQAHERKSLLERLGNPQDARSKQLRLTPAGEKVLKTQVMAKAPITRACYVLLACLASMIQVKTTK